MFKKLLPLLLLIALAMPALATDVQISAMTVDGFNPANIGNDRPIAVSTAGGSPTVTSAGLFPAQIVGMAGFRVLIDGSQYTVASVASTSSLTLTTNYSGTPGAQVMTLYRWVELRVYADKAFQPLGSTQVVQPGAVGSGSFFRRFAASVVNNGSTNQLFIPAITIPATTDALITNQARYTFPLYSPAGAQIQAFFCPSSLSQLKLPPATPTTWSAICQFNSAGGVVPPNNEAYTKAQIDQRLPSCSLNNGVYYSANGNILSCLTFGSGLTVVGSTLTATGGGTGYSTVQEEGGSLTQRGILNFIGTGIACADNGGATRTDCSFDPDLNAVASLATTGGAFRTAANTWALRTHTGTANEITVTNGDGVAGPPTYSLPAALTFTGKTVTNGTFNTPTISTPTITGGTHTALTGLGIRSTGSAFDLTLASTEVFTAGRTLTITLNDAARTLSLFGNLTTGGSFATTGTFSTGGNFATGGTFATTGTFSTGGNFSTASTFSTTGTFSSGGNFSTGAAFTTTPANALTLTTTGSTNVTLPTSGTVAVNTNNLSFFASTTSAQLAGVLSDETGSGANVFGTSPTLTTPKVVTSLNDTNGNELLDFTATGSAVNEFNVANAATGSFPALSAAGSDSNIDITLTPKGTGKVGVGTPGGSPVAGIVGGPNASGSNIAGVALDLHGGKGTGNAVPGGVGIRYPLVTASGTTVQSLSSSSYLVDTAMYSRTTGSSLSNSTTETSVFTLTTGSTGSTRTVEGGSARAGTHYRLTVYGTVGSTGTPTLRIRGKYGASTIADTTAAALANNTAGSFRLIVEWQFGAVGAAGAVGTFIFFDYGATTAGAVTPLRIDAGSSLGSLDTTVNNDLDVTLQFGTANAANTITIFGLYLERIR